MFSKRFTIPLFNLITEINLAVLACYRFERIVQDMAAFCEEILLITEGGVDREQGLRYF
jgi:hypothetical protein